VAKKRKEQSIKITQLRSLIGSKENQKRTMRALGLKRIRHSVIQQDTPQIRGMIARVQHLVSVEMM